MKFSRIRLTALLVLALVACSPGGLFAGCGVACPFMAAMASQSGHRCCPKSAALSVRAVSCCETVQAAPAEMSRGIRPPAPMFLALAAPLALPSEPLAEPRASGPPASPPPLYEGIGLYTLNSTFLI
jgi:hypothetical protein